MTQAADAIGPPAEVRLLDPPPAVPPLDLEVRNVLREVLGGAARLSRFPQASIMLHDQARDALWMAATIGFTDSYVARVGWVNPGVGSCGVAFAERRPVVVEDAWTDPLFSGLSAAVEAGGYRSVFSIPLMSDGGPPLGALAVHSRDRRAATERELEALNLYARLAAVSITNASLRVRADEAARRLSHLFETTRRQWAELESVYASAPIGLCVLDRSLRYLRINERLAEINGITAEAHIGLTPREIVPDLAEQAESLGRHVIETGEAVLDIEFSGETPAAPGVVRHWIEQWLPLRDDDGTVVGISVVAEEITERRRTAERLSLLARTGSVLARARLDIDETLRQVAELFVPRLGDACFADLVTVDGRLRRVAAAVREPALDAARERVHDLGLDDEQVAVVIRTRRPILIPRLDARVRPFPPDPDEQRTACEPLTLRSALIAPLVARDSTIAVLTIVRCSTDFSPADIAITEELAGRAALAADNALLFAAEQDARFAAEQANRAKSQFLSVVSHELRTPLNAVIGYADLLAMEARGPLTPAQRLQVERIKASAWVQLDLVDEVLGYARLEAGKESVRLAPVDLASVIIDAAELLRAQADAKALDLRIELPPQPVLVVSDAGKIRQILINLLSNAVKFTAAGRVSIRVNDDGHAARIEVADTGPGIAADKLEYVFKPFTQVDQSITRHHGGTGLGLAISRQLARLLGGDVTVESAVGQGSVFRFTIPKAAPA